MTIEQRVAKAVGYIRAHVIVVVILAACATTGEHCWKVVKDDPIALSSLRPEWKLYRTFWDEYGAPAEAYLRLAGMKGDDEKCVLLGTKASLAGLVRIQTAEHALEMVRLFSNPGTSYLFDDACLTEVQPTDRKPKAHGEIRRKDFDAFGFVGPQVRREGRDFIVTRYMAAPIEGSGWVPIANVFLVEERVGSGGEYTISTPKLVAKRVRVSTPRFY